MTSPRFSTTSRADPLQVVVLGHVVAPGVGPVAIAVEAAPEAVHLGNDLDPVAGADPLRLVEIDVDVLLQNLVVGVM